MNEEDADLAITKHLDKLRRIFSKSIGEVVYNDPKSLTYLAAVKLTRKLNTLQKELVDARMLIEQKEITDLKNKAEYLENQYVRLHSESHSLHAKIIESDRCHAREADQNKELKAYIIQLQQNNKIGWVSKIIRWLWK